MKTKDFPRKTNLFALKKGDRFKFIGQSTILTVVDTETIPTMYVVTDGIIDKAYPQSIPVTHLKSY